LAGSVFVASVFVASVLVASVFAGSVLAASVFAAGADGVALDEGTAGEALAVGEPPEAAACAGAVCVKAALAKRASRRRSSVVFFISLVNLEIDAGRKLRTDSLSSCREATEGFRFLLSLFNFLSDSCKKPRRLAARAKGRLSKSLRTVSAGAQTSGMSAGRSKVELLR
jgi:hypothetical protein